MSQKWPTVNELTGNIFTSLGDVRKALAALPAGSPDRKLFIFFDKEGSHDGYALTSSVERAKLLAALWTGLREVELWQIALNTPPDQLDLLDFCRSNLESGETAGAFFGVLKEVLEYIAARHEGEDWSVYDPVTVGDAQEYSGLLGKHFKTFLDLIGAKPALSPSTNGELAVSV